MDKKFFELCTQVVKASDLEIYDMDYLPGSHELRLFIMNPATKTAVIEDCIKIDRALTPFIDEEAWMPSELNLEVSSPGVYRNLTSLDHFKSAEGKIVQMTLVKRLEGDQFSDLPKKLKNQKKLTVNLLLADDTGVEVSLVDKKYNFKYNEIKKANLEIELA